MSLKERWIKPIWQGMNEKNTLGLAAQMAFWVFLSLVPLAAIAGFAAAKVAVTHQQDVLGPVLRTVPDAISKLVMEQLNHVAQWHGGVAPLAIATFVWLAASGVHSVFDAIEAQTSTCRPWWKKRVYAIALCVVLSIGFAAVGLLSAGFGWITRFAGEHVLGAWMSGALAWVIRVALAFAIAFGLICALYWTGLPPDARKKMPIWPGAILAIALMVVMGFGYGLYISRMGTGDAYQAGLAVVGITLTLLWLYSLAVLIGAELNRVLGEHRARQSSSAGAGTDIAGSEASCSPSRASLSRPTSPSRRIVPSSTPSRSPSA